MKTQDIRNMGLAMQQVQEASAVGADGAISGRDDDPAVQAARKKMRDDHAAKKAAKMAAHKMSIRKASGKSGKPDLSGASLDQLKAILKAKNSDRNKPKNEEVEVQEAGTATHKPNNGSDPEQGISPNAKKEKDRKSGVGVDANKAIDMSFKTFKAMSKKAPHNGNRTPPGDTAIVKSTMAPAANQKTEAVQVDELSKGTMGSYIKKAKSDMGSAEQDVGSTKSKAWMLDKKTNKIGDDAAKRSRKRKAGIDTAVDKLVKTEAVDENLSDMSKYKKVGKAKEPGVKMGKPIKGTIMKPVKAAYHGEAMDPVGKADADIDNDGDTDSTDKYLHNRRKAIRNKMKSKGKSKVGEKAVMHGGKSGEKKSKETMSVGEER